MALSEKHRSTLYTQLGDTVGDYEAVGELLSNIASRELDEPASRDFVAAQVQLVRTEISESEGRLTRYVHQELNGFRTEMAGFRSEIAGFRTEITGMRNEIAGFRTEIVGIRTEVAQLRAGIDGLRSDMNRTNQWMIGLVITLVLGLIASQFIGS